MILRWCGLVSLTQHIFVWDFMSAFGLERREPYCVVGGWMSVVVMWLENLTKIRIFNAENEISFQGTQRSRRMYEAWTFCGLIFPLSWLVLELKSTSKSLHCTNIFSQVDFLHDALNYFYLCIYSVHHEMIHSKMPDSWDISSQSDQ